MRKFKIVVIAHQLKNNVVAKTNDIVDESQLLGNADELVKAGFVVEVKEDDSFDLDKMTKKELVEFAKSNNFIVTESAKKEVILDEIYAQIKEQEVKGEVVVEE